MPIRMIALEDDEIDALVDTLVGSADILVAAGKAGPVSMIRALADKIETQHQAILDNVRQI